MIDELYLDINYSYIGWALKVKFG